MCYSVRVDENTLRIIVIEIYERIVEKFFNILIILIINAHFSFSPSLSLYLVISRYYLFVSIYPPTNTPFSVIRVHTIAIRRLGSVACRESTRN